MDNRKDLEYSISKNFQFKNKFSKSSLEHSAYESLVSGESTVANRMAKQEWIQSLLLNSKEAISQILEIKRTGRNVEGQEIPRDAQEAEIEQLKLRVLHELGWSYRGSFLPGAEDTYTDAQGVVRERGDSYPELSFFITSRKDGNNYWYAASYGIMKSSDSSDFGSYSYFATLDEALEFINDELLIVGRNALYKKMMQEAVRENIRKDNIKSMNDELYKKYVAKSQPRVEKRINTLISERVIEEKFHNVRRSTDIFVLPDLIEMFLLPISDSYLRVAKQGEFREKKAREITDTVAVDLDDDENMNEADTSEIALKSPEEVLREFEYDAIRRNQAQNEQESALSDNTQVHDFEPGQGGNLFGGQSPSVPLVPVTDEENLNNKPTHSPTPARELDRGHESSGLFTSTKVTPAPLPAPAPAPKPETKTVNVNVSSDVEDSIRDHQGAPQSVSAAALPPLAKTVMIGSDVEDRFQDSRESEIFVVSVAAETSDTFKEVKESKQSGATVSLSDNVKDTLSVITEDFATVSLSDSLEDSFEVVPRIEVSNASVSVSGDVEDAFVSPKITEKSVSVIDNHAPDTLVDENIKTVSVSVRGDIEKHRGFNPRTTRNLDAIEVDVAQETWDTINRDMNEFFDADRMPVRVGNSALAEDIDTFL